MLDQMSDIKFERQVRGLIDEVRDFAYLPEGTSK